MGCSYSRIEMSVPWHDTQPLMHCHEMSGSNACCCVPWQNFWLMAEVLCDPALQKGSLIL